MGISCGIVGLPNVGKSTLFNALTASAVAADNFAFCTIEPNSGTVAVPDSRLDALCELVSPQSVVPTVVEFVDIAGLVAGASQGNGRGNQFLSHIRQTDAIIQVVRCFEDDQVLHVDNRIDPLADIETINLELALADLQVVENSLIKLTKKAKSGDTEAKQTLVVLADCKAHLDAGKQLRTLDWADDTRALVKSYNFITQKPIVYLANVDEAGLASSELAERVEAHATTAGAHALRVCNRYEAELVGMDTEEKNAFLADIGQSQSGLDRFIAESYRALGLHTYFTAGVKEVRAWTIPVGATAREAAGAIHTDFARGFISAEVIAFAEYIACGGEKTAKAQGKMRQEGKQYIVQDGDVIHFLFNV